MPWRTGECACKMSGRVSSIISSRRRRVARIWLASRITGTLWLAADRCGGLLEVPPISPLPPSIETVLLGRRHVDGVPAPPALCRNDADGAKTVTALQWQGMVKNVQDLQGRPPVQCSKHRPFLSIALT